MIPTANDGVGESIASSKNNIDLSNNEENFDEVLSIKSITNLTAGIIKRRPSASSYKGQLSKF